MMSLTTLPLSFWDYALETAVRILNMVQTKKVDKTLYELWHGKVPNLSYLKVWGCEEQVKRHAADKLKQRSVKCIFVGYPKEIMGYYFYYPPENKVVVESEHPIEAESLALIIEEDVVPVQRFARTPKAPNRLCLNVEIGFTQTYGVGYEETFSPVADIKAIRILIAIAAYYGYEIWQMDVKTAFLNGFLDKEIYMEQPEGFVDPDHPRK
nr:retrotransposon protein, putative, Ty1-copia subclass [Tanacetum cinerariifolium]